MVKIMAFKKLSECFLYNSINASARTRILAEMGNQSLLSSSTMPEDVINEHLAVITRRYKFSNVIRIVETIRENKIIPLVYEKTQIPPFIPCWLVYNSEKEVVAVVNAAPYTKVQKNVFDIETKRFFGLMELGYVYLKTYGAQVRIMHNTPLLKSLAKIYTRMVMKVLDRNYSVNLDPIKSDQISYLIAKFFLNTVVGKEENETTRAIASSCCIKGIATQNQLLATEDSYTINFTIDSFFERDMPSAFNILSDMTLRGIVESYCKMYGDFNFLSLEFFPAFLSFVVTSATSSNFGNDALMQSVAGNELDSAFRMVNTVFND